MRVAAVIVCRGGYNTLCQVLSLGRPALVVLAGDHHGSHRRRARYLAARGSSDVLTAASTAPMAPADRIARLVRMSVPNEPCELPFCGTERAVDRIRARTAAMPARPHGDLDVALAPTFVATAEAGRRLTPRVGHGGSPA